jgi:hypothetical protein
MRLEGVLVVPSLFRIGFGGATLESRAPSPSLSTTISLLNDGDLKMKA